MKSMYTLDQCLSTLEQCPRVAFMSIEGKALFIRYCENWGERLLEAIAVIRESVGNLCFHMEEKELDLINDQLVGYAKHENGSLLLGRLVSMIMTKRQAHEATFAFEYFPRPDQQASFDTYDKIELPFHSTPKRKPI